MTVYYKNAVPPISSVQDYIMLMKPRVMSLVVFTSYCGMSAAPGSIHPVVMLMSVLLISLGAGSAAAINMWFDRDIDCIMQRTQRRPIVSGKIEPCEALGFGIITAVISVLLMALCVNLISAILLATTILYYVFVHTMWLKRTSIWNVVIGGVSGALPPVIGWSAVTGNISLESLMLFMIIFTWTPPHSWALALFRESDYKKCNIPMMPVVKGQLYTKQQILLYTILMLLSSSMPYFLGMVELVYFIISLILGMVFLWYTMLLFKDSNPSRPKKLFWYSIIYLFCISLTVCTTITL